MKTGRERGVTKNRTTEIEIIECTPRSPLIFRRGRFVHRILGPIPAEDQAKRVRDPVDRDTNQDTLKLRTLKFVRYVISDDGAYHEIEAWNSLSSYPSKDSAATRPSPYMIRISLPGSSSMSASTGYVQMGVSRS